MADKWTVEQLEVINTRNKNMIVSAAAGSGKTAVLVERIISLITDEKKPVDIDSLLVVTFTRAAASEMKERIEKALAQKLYEHPENIHLQKQRMLLHNAQIMTIHGFCLDVIRNYFHLIELDPAFRIAEDAELKMISGDVMSGLLEDYYQAADTDFLEFVECYGGERSDSGMETLIQRLYELAVSHAEPEKWLSGILENYGIDNNIIADNIWMKNLEGYIESLLSEALKLENEAMKICKQKNGPYIYTGTVNDDMINIERLINTEGYGARSNLIRNIGFGRLSAKKDSEIDPNLREKVKELRDKAKDYVKEIRDNFFYQEPDEMEADIKKSKSAMAVLVSLTIDFMHRFTEKKRDKNIIDFSDIEQETLKILRLGFPAQELADKYNEIMIDEYQDSNEVQEIILSAVSKENMGLHNRFMVGDVKQSIYKFRLARPEIFIDKYKSYNQMDDSVRIELHRNFRSREMILNITNDIFSKIMIEPLGGIDYDESAYLNPGAVFPPCLDGEICDGVEVIPVLWKSDDTKSEDNSLPEEDTISTEDTVSTEDMAAAELEANAVANRIEKLINEKDVMVWDKVEKKYRPVNYGDIVILLRSLKNRSDVFTSVLQNAGIPAYSDTGTGYMDAVEIVTALNYLRMLDNPEQDIATAAVLMSPIGELNEEDMSSIRTDAAPELSLYDAARECADISIGQRKLKNFFRIFDEIKSESRYLGIEQLLRDVYRKTGYYDYIRAVDASGRRCANLDMLLQKAASFEKTSYHGLFHFVRYIEKLKKYEIDYGESMTFENGNAVRIMSIHKSKGLEFPVVILAGAGGGFNRNDLKGTILMHPDLGLGPDCIDYRMRTTIPTLIKKSIANKMQIENMGEEMRVLYVACTRAKEKLIITGTVKGEYFKKYERWESMAHEGESTMRFSELLKAANYLDLIIPALLMSGKSEIINTVTAGQMISNEASRLENILYKRELLYVPSPDSREKALVDEYISYRYPHENSVNIKIKLSVSELKKQSQKIDEMETESVRTVPYETDTVKITPEFMKTEKTVMGTDRGTLYHKVMEYMPFNTDTGGIKAESVINEMILMGVISKEDSLLLNMAKLDEFSGSTLAARMRQAEKNNKLFRETPFVIGIPANEVYPENDSTETLLIQGIIDAYFIEDGEIILVDYKTDYLLGNDETLLVRRYAAQMKYYGKALMQLTGLRIKETLLYSFALGRIVRLFT